MRTLALTLLLLSPLAAGWPLVAPAEEVNFLLDDEEDEEEISAEEREREDLKRLIREERFDYVFRGIDTPPLAGRSVTINRTPVSDADLDRRILAPIFRIEIDGTTPTGAPYQVERGYLYRLCRRGKEEGRWLDRFPIYRCVL